MYQETKARWETDTMHIFIGSQNEGPTTVEAAQLYEPVGFVFTMDVCLMFNIVWSHLGTPSSEMRSKPVETSLQAPESSWRWRSRDAPCHSH